ncbi:hypothetical protein LguiA_030635 [Lonicera macranthoides]
MGTKMKGVLKGLRYISQIFENEKEEGELQIGFPTDVKHVAHIGSDGSAGSPPKWMNGFQGPSDLSTGGGESKDKCSTKDPSPQNSAELSSGPLSDNPTRKPKQSRRHNSSNDLNGSPARDPNNPRPRRNKSSNLESSNRESFNRPRRHKNSSIGDCPSQDGSTGPTKTHRRRSKDLSGRGSTSTKGRDPLAENGPGSDSGAGYGSKSKDLGKNSGLERHEEGNENDDISREIGAL